MTKQEYNNWLIYSAQYPCCFKDSGGIWIYKPLSSAPLLMGFTENLTEEGYYGQFCHIDAKGYVEIGFYSNGKLTPIFYIKRKVIGRKYYSSFKMACYMMRVEGKLDILKYCQKEYA